MNPLRALSMLFIVTLLAGCPAGTPKEQLLRIGAEIDTLADGSVRVSLRGKEASIADLSAATSLCWNHPQEYPELRELDLSQSKLTDEGLEYLRMNVSSIPDLEVLDLSETDVSDEAVAELQAALPDCQIIR